MSAILSQLLLGFGLILLSVGKAIAWIVMIPYRLIKFLVERGKEDV